MIGLLESFRIVKGHPLTAGLCASQRTGWYLGFHRLRMCIASPNPPPEFRACPEAEFRGVEVRQPGEQGFSACPHRRDSFRIEAYDGTAAPSASQHPVCDLEPLWPMERVSGMYVAI